jgi:hypothetical protein
VTRDHHDRKIRVLAFHEIEHLKPVQPAALQPDVQEHEVGPPRFDCGECLFGRTCGAGAVSLVFQNAGHEVADVGLVVDDQNVSAH